MHLLGECYLCELWNKMELLVKFFYLLLLFSRVKSLIVDQIQTSAVCHPKYTSNIHSAVGFLMVIYLKPSIPCVKRSLNFPLLSSLLRMWLYRNENSIWETMCLAFLFCRCCYHNQASWVLYVPNGFLAFG